MPANAVTRTLLNLVSHIPGSDEPAGSHPLERARSIARLAALKAAGIAGALVLPPGPFGLMTILPDLITVWRVQQSMVADIAAAFGKSALLQQETMIYCLFKQAGPALMRDLVARVGERYLVRRAARRAIQQVLEEVGLKVTQRMMGKGVSRLIPILGAVGVGAYAYHDTLQVAATAIDLFSRNLELETSERNSG